MAVHDLDPALRRSGGGIATRWAGASWLRVRVFRSGLLARFGHDLQFHCGRFAIEREDDKLVGRFCTRSLTLDGALHRGQVRSDLLCEDDVQKIHLLARKRILRSDEFPEARFDGCVREENGASTVDGTLTLLGRRLALPLLQVRPGQGRVRVAIALRPSRWGVEQVQAFGGALRLEDRVEVQLDMPVPVDRARGIASHGGKTRPLAAAELSLFSSG